ncbi:MAG: elongation factor G [Peptococcaceae bacterium]|nr:elongation factor G [Peptococcaceae bacterium]
MKSYPKDKIRNIAVVSHGNSGKTSLLEAALFDSGSIGRMGKVEEGNTVSDYHPEEINHQISIHTSLIPIEWKGYKLNLLDTPGYSDFIGEVKSSLRVTDNTLFVVSAVDGVEVQTEIIWDFTEENDVPRMVFINKMDRENANFYKVLDELKECFDAPFAPIQLPIGQAADFRGIVDLLQEKAYSFKDGKTEEIDIPEDMKEIIDKYREKLMEAAVEGDDVLMMKYLEGENFTPEEIRNSLFDGVKEGLVVPVLCGSATKNMGVGNMLDFMTEYLPAPEAQDNKDFSALVFKTLADPYVGKMNFIRVYSGTLKPEMTIINNTNKTTETVGKIIFTRGKNTASTSEVSAGDIAVLVKLHNINTGDVLTDKDHPVDIEGISFPEPTLSLAINPKSKGDEDKLGNAVNKILEEDKTITIKKNVDTKQTLITGMGEMHLDIIVEHLKRRYSVDVVAESPKVPYRETIRGEIKVEGKHKKQTGGHGQFGHVWLRLEPSLDQDFEFVEEVFGGSVPKNYFPAVEKGIREAMNEGVLAGYPVTGVRAVLVDGSYHPVDSSEMAFKIAGSLAFKKGVTQAKPVILEPFMYVEVTLPEKFMGEIISYFNNKRGKILGMEPGGKNTKVKAQAPLSEMYRFAISLKSITQGRGSFVMDFKRYEEVSPKLAEEIIKKAKVLVAE